MTLPTLLSSAEMKK